MLYLKFENDRYFIPEHTHARWTYWQGKIENAKALKNKELYDGSIVAFKSEFENYKIELKTGSLWKKITDKYAERRNVSNPIGTLVKISKVSGEYILYQKYKKVWKFNVGIGQKYCLNVWSFLNIFEKYQEIIND